MAGTSLYEELLSSIKEMPVVDIHNHLNPEALSPRGIDDIIFYHYIVTELATAGMPWKELEELRGVERLRRALSYLGSIRNTSTYWCLMQILRELYGFKGKYIDQGNWSEVVKLIEAAVGDEKRALELLKKKVPVKKSLLTLQPFEPIPKYDQELFTGALRMDPLLPNLNPATLRRFEEVVGVEVRTPDDLAEGIKALIKKFEGHIAALTVGIQPDDDFVASGARPSDAKPYIENLKKGASLEPLGRRILNSFILEELANIASERKLVLQLMVGVKRPVPGASPPDYAIVMYSPRQVLDIALFLSRHPDTRFDLIHADPLLNHQLAVVAKNYPNAFLSGYWWFSMYPEFISLYIRTRLQMLPYTKTSGFFSDAYVADWVYGKAALAKKELARTLATMVEEGYIDKELALEIAEALLHGNAERLYRL